MATDPDFVEFVADQIGVKPAFLIEDKIDDRE